MVTAKKALEPVESSPEAEILLASGAAPTEVDAATMLAQIKELQAKVASLSVAAGIPTDPVAAALKNLKDHLEARDAQHPNHDFGEALKLVKELSGDSVVIKPQDVELVRVVVDELIDNCRNIWHELAYLPELARNLYRETLKASA